jgi:hypothetical protein
MCRRGGFLATFDTTPSLRRRINAPSLLLAFAHIHGEAGTPALGICSAVVGRNGPFVSNYVQKGWISMQNDPILATFDTTLSPHARINAPSLLLNFVHIHGEAGTPALGICSAVVGRNGPFLTMCRRGGFISIMQNDPILATFDTTPSPQGRINAPSLLLAFSHMHGEAGTPALGICSAVVGRNGPFLTMCRRGGFPSSCKKRPHSRYIRHHPVAARANQCT